MFRRSIRGLFLIDKNGIVRHSVINDLPQGRSVNKAIRVLDALRRVETHGEKCPAYRKQGEEAMKPARDGVAEYLAAHS